MKLKEKPVALEGKDGSIVIERNRYGIPEITAASMRDSAFAMGWVHANDRQLQIMLTRAILEGRSSEKLSADPALVEADRYIRSINLYPDIDEQMKRLEPEVLQSAKSYAGGVNLYLENSPRLMEFRLLGYTPEPWEVKDTMMLAKSFTYFGLTDVQGNMEKLIVQMVQNDIGEDKLRELFPYLKEKIDSELLKKV
ncbi:MAG TPA: penicillin acylase family protein, partial [Spirochaetota bacterium]|nr:penicillin acylase family protein [Spirochaetota bacterium]